MGQCGPAYSRNKASCAKFATDERSVISRTADSAGLSGVWRRTVRASRGLARNPAFGDGNPDRPNDMKLPERLADLVTTEDGQPLVGIRGAGLKWLVGDKLESYPLRSAINPAEQVPDQDVKTNKLLRDRDGGVWIGTDGRGLLHVKDGKADAFAMPEVFRATSHALFSKTGKATSGSRASEDWTVFESCPSQPFRCNKAYPATSPSR